MYDFQGPNHDNTSIIQKYIKLISNKTYNEIFINPTILFISSNAI